MPARAAEKGLKPLPAVPEGASTQVLLTDDVVNAAEFLDLASELQARILYFDSTTFTAEGFAVLDEELDPGIDKMNLTAQDRRELGLLRGDAHTRDGQISEVEMCFVAAGMNHRWVKEAPWHADLQARWSGFLEDLHLSAAMRAQDAHTRAKAEAGRIAALLAERPDFRAATKRSRFYGIADEAYPPPSTGNAEQLHQHRITIDRATDQAMALVDTTAHRIYTGYERDFDALTDEITQQDVLAAAGTVAARNLLLREYLTRKSGGYPPPKRFMELLMLHPQLRRPRQTQTALA
ncbi:hypothetical protein [Streptomyces sp. NPDC089919]|uniref:hypothetical protein n=1 Tax=Streptomyces sp. NPDC089919 TaxID=3155188 RepID=UPI003422C36F